MPIYITQLIYIKEGQEETFHQFEDLVLPFIPQYNGKLLLRLRPTVPEVVIEKNMETPYEVHLVEFPEDKDFQNYMQDEERKKFLYLKEQSIKAAILIHGKKL